jgi:virginiamycin B lyase
MPSATARPVPLATASPTFAPLQGCRADVETFPTRVGGRPTSLAMGADRAIWFANGSVIGRMTPSGSVRTFALPDGVRSFSIANGFGGELWFTDQGTTAIGRISPSGKVRMFPTPTREGNPIGVGGAANPFSITKGPDGAMWFTESAADRIGRITPEGVITEYELPSYDRVHANPQGIVLGPDDRLWFVQPLDGTIAAFDPKTKRFREYDLPIRDAFPADITSANGVVFVADPNNGIVRVKPDGTATVSRLPTPDQQVWQVGVSGNAAWYLETKRGTIGRIAADGRPYTVATRGKGALGVEAHPSIGSGPDGTWFVESQARRLGRVRILCT